MKVRKKPVEVEALQWNGEEERFREIQDLAKDSGRLINRTANGKLEIPTLEGVMTADDLDYIIKGISGEVYPCKPDIFKQTYDVVSEVQDRAQRISNLSFAEAMTWMENGSCVARIGWGQDRNHFVFRVASSQITAEDMINGALVPRSVRQHYLGMFAHTATEEKNGTGPKSLKISCPGYFVKCEGKDTLVTGWEPSSVDVVAHDWIIVGV